MKYPGSSLYWLLALCSSMTFAADRIAVESSFIVGAQKFISEQQAAELMLNARYTINGSDPLARAYLEDPEAEASADNAAKGVPSDFMYFPEKQDCPGSLTVNVGKFNFWNADSWWPAYLFPANGCRTPPKYTLICTVEDQYVVMASTRLWQWRNGSTLFVSQESPRLRLLVRETQYSDVLYLYKSGGGCPI